MAKAYLVEQEMSMDVPVMDISSISGNTHRVQGMRRLEYTLRYVSYEPMEFPHVISTESENVARSICSSFQMEFID